MKQAGTLCKGEKRTPSVRAEQLTKQMQNGDGD
jgi:hypothetical protein